MLCDLRSACRQISRNRLPTAVAVLTLTLGIGATTAIYSVIHSVLIETLPYPEPSEIVGIFETVRDGSLNSVSGGAFKDWREHSTSFRHLGISEPVRQVLTGIDEPERISGLRVSVDYLAALGVAPRLGRSFAVGEDTPAGDSRVLILTDRYWRTRFGADEKIVGRTLSLDEVSYTVIGVLAPNALLEPETQFLVPVVVDSDPEQWTRAGHWRSVVGRLAPGTTLSAAQTELRAVKQRLNQEYPSFKEDWSVAVVPLREIYTGNARPILIVLLGTAALVLLIACANVSNLLLARGQARSREMAVRAALGAHRWRIVRQMLVESVVLAMGGCVFGVLLASFGVEWLSNTVARDLPGALRPQLDVQVLAFSILVAGAGGLLFGVLPALRASRAGVSHDLKDMGRASASGAKRRSQSFLVVAEFALTLLLLVGSGLFLRSFVKVLATDPGFDTEDTLAFDLAFPDTTYPEREDRLALIEDLMGRLGALPGVESVGATSYLPLSNSGRTELASRTDEPERSDYVVACHFVSDGYLETMGMTLLRGRTLDKSDLSLEAARVLVVDSGLAKDLYPDEDPIGRQLRFLGDAWEIVGIIAPVRHFVLDRDPQPAVYLPKTYSTTPTSLVVRSALAPAALADSVRRAVRRADPNQPVANLRTLDEARETSLAHRRMTLSLLALFAAVALVLASIGIYGVMSYAVGQRARELGIRSALGARRRDVLGLVLREGMKLSLIGVLVGLGGALAMAPLLESLLFGVEARDPLVVAGSVGLLIVLAVVSVFLPALRAATANPVHALRAE